MVHVTQPVRVFVGCACAVAAAGSVAVVTGLPFLFPSLGPMAMLHMTRPQAPESSPRNSLIGHAVALLAGYGWLVTCGLTHDEATVQKDMNLPRVVAAAGALAVTTVVLLLLRSAHPPAGATTLIVSLGLLHTPSDVAVAAAAVGSVTAVDWLFNRMTGQPMPVWSAGREPTGRPAGPPAYPPPLRRSRGFVQRIDASRLIRRVARPGRY